MGKGIEHGQRCRQTGSGEVRKPRRIEPGKPQFSLPPARPPQSGKRPARAGQFGGFGFGRFRGTAQNNGCKRPEQRSATRCGQRQRVERAIRQQRQEALFDDGKAGRVQPARHGMGRKRLQDRLRRRGSAARQRWLPGRVDLGG